MTDEERFRARSKKAAASVTPPPESAVTIVSPTGPRPTSRVRVAVVIAAIVVVAIGLVAVLDLLGGDQETPVIAEPASTTIGTPITAAGLNWVRVPIDEDGWLMPKSLATTPSGFVLFARPTAESSWPPEPAGPLSRWGSTNGLQWTPVGTDEEVFRPEENLGLVAGNRWGVAAIGVVYSKVGDDLDFPEFVIWTSNDGRSWQRADWPTGGDPNETPGVGPTGYLLGERRDDQSRVPHSPDGLTWDLIDLPGDVEVIAGAGFAGGFVAWGGKDDEEGFHELLLTSPNGSEWTIRSMDEALEHHGTTARRRSQRGEKEFCCW